MNIEITSPRTNVVNNYVLVSSNISFKSNIRYIKRICHSNSTMHDSMQQNYQMDLSSYLIG